MRKDKQKMGKKDLSLLKKPDHKGLLEETKEPASPAKTKTKKAQPKKATGRPPVKDEEKRTEFVRTYLTKAEKAKFQEKIKAFAPGIEISESNFLRKVLIDNDLI